MTKLILRLTLFFTIGFGIGEIVVRFFHLTSDIPERYIDSNGIQLYKPGQNGYFVGSNESWHVNEYGWVGINSLKNNNARKISIIGDSYIENLMNPSKCNQSNLLKGLNENFGFFEAGRSGVTFIEAMEIAKHSDSLNFDRHLIYVSNADFEESFAHIHRYTDRMQYDIKNNSILKGELRSPGLKKILYSTKFLYYLYLRFPLFVNEQNLGETEKESLVFDGNNFNKLLDFCNENYNMDKITLVFHPNTSEEIIAFFNTKKISNLLLKQSNDKSWDINPSDRHWSCYGHKEAAKQISSYLNSLFE